jgi:hypothetical protein
MRFLASGADAHASSSNPTPKAPSATSAGGDHNLSDQISLRNGRDPNATDATEMAPLPSEGDMPDAQSTNQHLSSKKHASQNPETPTNSENLSPGENMEMEADSGDALVASLASLPNKTYQLVVDVNRQFQVHQSSQETSMNETQVETPMVSVGSRGLSVHEYQMKLAVNSQV